jgi:hypothetical protein
VFRTDHHRWAHHSGPLAALIALALPAVPLHLGTAEAAAATTASVVGDWNLHALDALANPPDAPTPGAGQYPPVAELHLAMVHGAIYDAVNAIDGSYQPVLDGLAAASPSASLEAAVATAAHDVLVGLGTGAVPPLPDEVVERLDSLEADALAAIPDGAAKTDGITAGADAAATMLAARADDGRNVPSSYPVGDQPGQWRPVPPDDVDDEFAWLANVEPFLLDSPSQFRTAGPLALDSAEYAVEYAEVHDLGGADSARDAEQQAVADFYNVSPVELFNRTFRTVAQAQGLTLVEEARLFAMLNLATADSVINCWNDKVHWSFWRPITAIHEGDNDGNDTTVGDPEWTPLVPTPPYPDHTSGYNCVTSAMMHAADSFFGGEPVAFDVVRIAPDTPDVTRSYEAFTDVIDDTIDARVYQGIHFRTADVQGAEIGADVAGWLAANSFQPATDATGSAPSTTATS